MRGSFLVAPPPPPTVHSIQIRFNNDGSKSKHLRFYEKKPAPPAPPPASEAPVKKAPVTPFTSAVKDANERDGYFDMLIDQCARAEAACRAERRRRKRDRREQRFAKFERDLACFKTLASMGAKRARAGLEQQRRRPSPPVLAAAGAAPVPTPVAALGGGAPDAVPGAAPDAGALPPRAVTPLGSDDDTAAPAHAVDDVAVQPAPAPEWPLSPFRPPVAPAAAAPGVLAQTSVLVAAAAGSSFLGSATPRRRRTATVNPTQLELEFDDERGVLHPLRLPPTVAPVPRLAERRRPQQQQRRPPPGPRFGADRRASTLRPRRDQCEATGRCCGSDTCGESADLRALVARLRAERDAAERARDELRGNFPDEFEFRRVAPRPPRKRVIVQVAQDAEQTAFDSDSDSEATQPGSDWLEKPDDMSVDEDEAAPGAPADEDEPALDDGSGDEAAAPADEDVTRMVQSKYVKGDEVTIDACGCTGTYEGPNGTRAAYVSSVKASDSAAPCTCARRPRPHQPVALDAAPPLAVGSKVRVHTFPENDPTKEPAWFDAVVCRCHPPPKKKRAAGGVEVRYELDGSVDTLAWPDEQDDMQVVEAAAWDPDALAQWRAGRGPLGRGPPPAALAPPRRSPRVAAAALREELKDVSASESGADSDGAATDPDSDGDEFMGTGPQPTRRRSATACPLGCISIPLTAIRDHVTVKEALAAAAGETVAQYDARLANRSADRAAGPPPPMKSLPALALDLNPRNASSC